MPGTRDREWAMVGATELLLPAADAGRSSGDVNRTQDVVLAASVRREGLPTTQCTVGLRLRHDRVLRAKCFTRPQVASTSRLLREYYVHFTSRKG